MSATAAIIATVVTTGVALAGLLLYLFRWVRQDIQRIDSRIDTMEHRLSARIDAVNARIDSLISLFTRPGSAA